MPATAIIRSLSDLFLFLEQEKVLERYRLQSIGVFGSMARGEPFNDIDLLVEDKVDYKTLISLKQFLESATGYKVDLVHAQFAEPLILHRALKDVRRYAITS